MTINHINAGIIHTQARMAGLTLDQALTMARTARLEADLRDRPQRAAVVRILRRTWLRCDEESARNAKARAAAEAFDAAVAATYPKEWAAACAKENGKKRRAGKLALRHRFNPKRYEI